MDKEKAAKEKEEKINTADTPVKMDGPKDQDFMQNLLGNGIKKIMKKKNEEIFEKIKQTDNEQEKLKLWDAHIAQKMIDDRPENTLKIKLSDYFRSICPSW